MRSRLELADSRSHMQDEPARWTRRVDALAERDEADAERVQLVE